MISNDAEQGRAAASRATPTGRALRVVLAVVWTLVAAEFFLRVFAPVPMLPRYVVATDYGIRGNQPSSTYTHRTPDYTVEIRTNAQGIRADREIPLAKPPGVKRILVLGDSFGMGYGVNLEDTFLTQMENRLGAVIGPVETVNLSVSGHGNAEQLLALREAGLAFAPDLVLLAWHRTDVADNVRSGLFRLRDGTLERKNETFLPSVEVRAFLFSFAGYRWLAGNSHLYNFLREEAGGAAKDALGAVRAIARLGTARDVGPIPAPAKTGEAAAQRAAARPYPEQLTLALLEAIEHEAESQGAGLVVLDIPNTRGRSRFDSAFPDLTGTPLEGRLRVVSPLSRFREHEGRLIYWERSHFHLTPFGCDLVGDLLAEYVLDQGLLTPRAVD